MEERLKGSLVRGEHQEETRRLRWGEDILGLSEIRLDIKHLAWWRTSCVYLKYDKTLNYGLGGGHPGPI